MPKCVSCEYKKKAAIMVFCGRCYKPVCKQCLVDGMCNDCYTEVICSKFTPRYEYDDSQWYTYEVEFKKNEIF